MPAKPADSVTPVDVHVGRVLRAVRRRQGVSQEQLAEALGVGHQQVQKYEHALNRISASKMFEAATFLGVSPAAFFEGLEGASQASPQSELATFFSQAGAAEIAVAYLKLNPVQQQAVVALVTGMAD